MNFDWPLPASCSPDTSRALLIDEILLYYDGPQIISWTSGAGQHVLGIAADNVGALTRWIEVPLPLDVWTQVLSGARDLQDVFLKFPFYVVDRNDDLEVVNTWQAQPGQLLSNVLPSSGARLSRPTPAARVSRS